MVRRGDVDHGYVVHAPDDDCKESVSRARSKAICALAARGIVLSDKRTWPQTHPARNHYSNREGAQVAVAENVDQGSDEGDVIMCHSMLKRIAHDNSELAGIHLKNVHVRFPIGGAWKPPTLGWHVERGAGCGLNCTCIVHFTSVPVGGGGVAVVVGSHKFVKRVFSWSALPAFLRASFYFHVLLGYFVFWGALCGLWEIREVVAAEGGIVEMDPYLVHSPSRNVSTHARLTCQVRAFNPWVAR
jgi:hypothetical protein